MTYRLSLRTEEKEEKIVATIYLTYPDSNRTTPICAAELDKTGGITYHTLAGVVELLKFNQLHPSYIDDKCRQLSNLSFAACLHRYERGERFTKKELQARLLKKLPYGVVQLLKKLED